MSAKTIFLSALCFATCVARAQSVNITFPSEGSRQVWIASELAQVAPTEKDGVVSTKASADVPIQGHKDGDTVYVWDLDKNNIASKSLKDAKASPWILKPEDFKSIGLVRVTVEHDGKAVAAALVDIDDSRRKVAQLLGPSSKGQVSFFGVKPGSLKVTVHYKVGGKDATPVTQLIDAPLDRKDPTPDVAISLADAADTVAASSADNSTPTGTAGTTPSGTPATGSAEAPKAESSSVGNILGRILIFVVVLAAIGSSLYYAWMYAKKNPDSLGSKLEQLGVQIPKPGSDPLTDPSQMPTPARAMPAPVQKIILDDSAPDPIGQPAVASSIGPIQPRLVSSVGDALPLPEGDLVVGREVGLGLSLVGESTVSRKHAQLVRSGDQVTVTDLGSTNGTFINGVQLQGEKQLQNGDAVQFGSVRFRYEG